MKIEKEGTMRGTRCDALPKARFSSDNAKKTGQGKS
jgi:hypothetical protein